MDRWYPLPFMENVENTRAEALNETANSVETFIELSKVLEL